MIFIDACFKKKVAYTPIWMMRQAGRYLSEYRQVRQEARDFISLCKDYKKASIVSLQPVEILDVDAAIIFSDILVVPMEMGMELEFRAGDGPVFVDPIKDIKDLDKLDSKKAINNLKYVYDAIGLTRDKLDPKKALIGFCGSPWTIATYMIEGKGSKSYTKSKKILYQNPEFLHKILSKLSDTLKIYLENQILAGADAIQIFDSWGGALEYEAFYEFSFKYMIEIVDYIKNKYPHIAIIVFPKGVGCYIDGIYGDFEVFGVDWGMPLDIIRDKLGAKYTLQGNLDPARLYSKEAIKKGVKDIISIMKGHHHIFNLGHGINPDTSVENARYFINLVKEESSKCK